MELSRKLAGLGPRSCPRQTSTPRQRNGLRAHLIDVVIESGSMLWSHACWAWTCKSGRVGFTVCLGVGNRLGRRGPGRPPPIRSALHSHGASRTDRPDHFPASARWACSQAVLHRDNDPGRIIESRVFWSGVGRGLACQGCRLLEAVGQPRSPGVLRSWASRHARKVSTRAMSVTLPPPECHLLVGPVALAAQGILVLLALASLFVKR